MAYLKLTVVLSKNHSLIPLLLDISKDYKPVQAQSVFTLLSLLYDGAKIFMNCLKQNAKKEKSNEEKLATEIIRFFNNIIPIITGPEEKDIKRINKALDKLGITNSQITNSKTIRTIRCSCSRRRL